VIVGISGPAGAGKDTAANYLFRTHGFRKIAFALPLKRMAKIAFGFTHAQLFGDEKETPDERFPFAGSCLRCGAICAATAFPSRLICSRCQRAYPSHLTPRLVLQTLGTDWGRRLYDDVWVDAVMRVIDFEVQSDWVISDVRFTNEMAAIRARQGLCLRIKRGPVRHDHPSETELAALPDSEFDSVIDNRGSIEELNQALDDWIEEMAR